MIGGRLIITSLFLLLALGISARADSTKTIDLQEAEKVAKELLKYIEQGNEAMVSTKIRDLVRTLPKENLKYVGIDLKRVTLRVGTATYYDGEAADITLMPFWPTLRGYAHIVQNANAAIYGVGYLKGTTSATHKTTKGGAFRSKTVPDTMTRLISYGQGNLIADGPSNRDEACGKLERDWYDIVAATADDSDPKTLIVLTDDYYCPELLREKVKGYYREVEVQVGYASDGTPIDVLVGTDFRKESHDRLKPTPKKFFFEKEERLDAFKAEVDHNSFINRSDL